MYTNGKSLTKIDFTRYLMDYAYVERRFGTSLEMKGLANKLYRYIEPHLNDIKSQEEVKYLKKTLELIWEHCEVIYYPDDLTYPLEHNLHAHKDMRNEIEKYLDEME